MNMKSICKLFLFLILFASCGELQTDETVAFPLAAVSTAPSPAFEEEEFTLNAAVCIAAGEHSFKPTCMHKSKKTNSVREIKCLPFTRQRTVANMCGVDCTYVAVKNK